MRYSEWKKRKVFTIHEAYFKRRTQDVYANKFGVSASWGIGGEFGETVLREG